MLKPKMMGSKKKKKDLKKIVFNVLSTGNYDLEKTNKEIAEELDTFIPGKYETIARHVSEYKMYKKKEAERAKMRNVLVISDTHIPFENKKALEALKKARDEYNITDVVHIGDLFDMSAINTHTVDPNGLSAEQENDKAEKAFKEWKKEFPEVLYVLGNHDVRPNRKAFNAGISDRWVKTVDEVYDLSGWSVAESHQIGDFLFVHGMGQNTLSRSKDLGLSVIAGHLHSKFEVKTWFDRPNNKIRHAVQVGSLIDDTEYAFAYGKNNKKSISGFAVILDAEGIDPIVILKPLR